MKKSIIYIFLGLLGTIITYGIYTNHSEISLACGIFGCINKHKRDKFNYAAFTTLGIANDTRGGDSCGIFIDGNTEYGVNTHKLFSSFYKQSPLLANTHRCHIALGHCRKASVGVIDEEHAQPVIIKENDEVKFVVMHNGTIYNYEELAKKYIPTIDIKNMTDSQVMAHIFYNAGYDVLKEYNGAATFIIVDYRKEEPLIYFFKGASKFTDASNCASEERPFYFITNHNTFIFSSIQIWLAPFAKGKTVYTITPNTLIQLIDNDITGVQSYDRSKCIQSKSTPATSYYYKMYGATYDYTNYWKDYYQLSQNTNTQANVQTTLVPAQSQKTDTLQDSQKEFVSIDMENRWRDTNDKLVHGVKCLDLDGQVTYGPNTKEYYFWNGYLLKNKSCYTFLKSFYHKANFPETDITSIPCLLNLLKYFSFYPVGEEQEDGTTLYYTYDEINKKTLYTGTFQNVGENYNITVRGGVVDDCSPTTSTYYMTSLYHLNQQFHFNCGDIYQYIIKESESIINK